MCLILHLFSLCFHDSPFFTHFFCCCCCYIDKIQRALGQYLERQRTSFPRFYFVGDEDLLEIIGNSKDPMQVQRHVDKMFAAISNLEIDAAKNKNIVLGMSSKEGEIVMYDTVVDVVKNPKINVWLSAVENQMQRSLATLLENALGTMPTTTTSSSSGSGSKSGSKSESEHDVAVNNITAANAEYISFFILIKSLR